MKEIQIPPPVALTDFEGNPIKDETGTPATLSLTQLVRQVIATPKFTDGLDAFDGPELLRAVVGKLRDANGKLHLEDEEHRRLMAALKEIKPHPHVALSALPLMQAIRDAKPCVSPTAEAQS